LSVKVELVIVDGSIAREKRAWGWIDRTTPVSPSAGLSLTTEGGALESSRMLAAGVAGRAPISARMFVVACWMSRFGSPTAKAFMARPRFQWFVPVVTTSAPLGAVYLTIIAVAGLFWR
jgi:hypothetical protein